MQPGRGGVKLEDFGGAVWKTKRLKKVCWGVQISKLQSLKKAINRHEANLGHIGGASWQSTTTTLQERNEPTWGPTLGMFGVQVGKLQRLKKAMGRHGANLGDAGC